MTSTPENKLTASTGAIETSKPTLGIATPFVFSGELGWYEFASTFGTGRMEVVQRSDGSLAGMYEGGHISINPDGTFAGGRITGRMGVSA